MTAIAPSALTVLGRAAWQDAKRRHEDRVQPWIEPRLQRRLHGERHPVDDFLFEYYQFRPAQLARWHPGVTALLEGPAPHLAGITGFVERDGLVGVDPAAVGRSAALLPAVTALLAATAGRPPRLGCSALHEWAMVYRAEPTEIRHSGWLLRLPPAEIASVVERVGLRCTHFDAFRFFTPAAALRNPMQLTRAGQTDAEQPGCLHANMDLYKWAYRCFPLVAADLVADAFALARECRQLDMRAAPYDLRALGIVPLPIETAAGRAEFVVLQRELAERGNRLRARLRDELARAQAWCDAYRSS